MVNCWNALPSAATKSAMAAKPAAIISISPRLNLASALISGISPIDSSTTAAAAFSAPAPKVASAALTPNRNATMTARPSASRPISPSSFNRSMFASGSAPVTTIWIVPVSPMPWLSLSRIAWSSPMITEPIPLTSVAKAATRLSIRASPSMIWCRCRCERPSSHRM